MKNNLYRSFILILASVVLIIPTLVHAQNYSLFQNADSATYRVLPNSAGHTSGYFNNYTFSPIKQIKVDSVATDVNSTSYFQFKTWRDHLPDTCSPLNGPSWLGAKVVETNSGTTWLFNEQGDSMDVERNSSPGMSWLFMNIDSGGTIRAICDSITFDTVAGISDSVRHIHLEVYDSLGFPNPSHIANNVQLELSKSHGWFRFFSVREFPVLIAVLGRIENIPMASKYDIYNYDINDEFEFTYSCSGSPPAYFSNLITDKWISQNSDTVFYARFNRSMTQVLVWVPFPHLEQTYSSNVDTIFYTHLSDPLFPGAPEENYDCFLLTKDSLHLNNRPVYSATTGFVGFGSDTCIGLTMGESNFYTRYYAPGLGEIAYDFDESSQMGPVCHTSLVWFKKGTEIYGIQTVIDNTFNLDNRKSEMTVFPNPAEEKCFVRLNDLSIKTITLRDFQGKDLSIIPVQMSQAEIDLSELSSGIYFLTCVGDHSISTSKLVHLRKE